MSMYIDHRNGGPHSNRATDNQLRRLSELKIEFDPRLSWLEAKALFKAYYEAKAEARKQKLNKAGK